MTTIRRANDGSVQCHKTTSLSFTDLYGRVGNVDVDSDMVPLITETWKAGILTDSCCQNDVDDRRVGKPRFAHISFVRERDFKKFMSIMADYEDPRDLKMYDMVHDREYFDSRFNIWDHEQSVTHFPDDHAQECKLAKHPIPNIKIRCNLHINVKILDMCAQKMKDYNVKWKNKSGVKIEGMWLQTYQDQD